LILRLETGSMDSPLGGIAMLAKVKVKDIRPNPFQARKNFDKEAIQALADEIKSVGLWPGALRGRRKDGHVELCFGHRRLEAVKVLKWPEVEVDVVELTDEEMATQSLIENLQRQGLNDVEKAEGIVSLVKQLRKSRGYDENKAIQEIASMLGLSVAWTKNLIQLASYDESAKDEIRKGRIAGRTAMEANRVGGPELVKTAAEKKIPVHKLTDIGKKIGEISDPQIRETIKKKVVKGEIVEPEEIQKKARQMVGKSKKDDSPPDLVIVIAQWTREIDGWIGQLDQVTPYIEYIDGVPKIADAFRKSVRELIARLQKFV
jgi:ParB family transcriptional regulator, chromosome partitioning protein